MSEVYTAFIAFQAEALAILASETAIVETKGGGTYTYDYANLPSILDVVKPALMRHGLALSQDVTTIDGKPAVSTFLIHTSGETMAWGPLALPGGTTPQGFGSAITYGRRYAILAALGLAPEEDDDGAQATAEAQVARSARNGPQTGADRPLRAQEAMSPSLAPGVSNIISALNRLPAVQRTATMTEFMRLFGPPNQLPAERVAEAAAWVADRASPVEHEGPWSPAAGYT